jgi:peptidoglycan glycosyltransferase
MNRQIRRVAIAVGVLIAALLVNLNFVQVVKSDSYRNNKNNRRVILNEYSSPRGSIIVQGTSIAESVPTKDELKYLRKYPGGPAYAGLTGWYSLIYDKNGLEDVEDGLLSGNDSRLLGTRITDLLTGRTPKGGSVLLTINKAAQRAAYDALDGRRGAVVALDPQTGAILAAASAPSYDPGVLSSHNLDSISAAYQRLNNEKNEPLLNRAFQSSYPPGSIFKVIVAAAALKAGKKPNDKIPAPNVLQLPAGGTMRNFNGETCGNGKTATLVEALTISCNTAFGDLGVTLGQQAVSDEANLFGMDGQDFTVPLLVSRSTLGQVDDGSQLAQSSIGQFNVQMTPLQAAMISAAVENDGTLMKPYLVKQELAPDLSVLDNTEPQELNNVLDPSLDDDLKSMMVNVVQAPNGTGRAAQIPDVTVGGKTGTADNDDAQGHHLAPHAWFTGFAEDRVHPIAVAVVLENAGVRGNESAGGLAAAPVAQKVMQAYLDDMRGR